MGGIARLSAADMTNLAVEAPDTPMHQAVLASLDASPLVDAEGHLRMREIRGHVVGRLDRVPELRQVLRRTHLFEGRPIWIDDPHFRIEDHVVTASLPSPGGEAAALRFAEARMAELMDRSRPLWRMWLLDGYGPDRVGLFLKVHHALADGQAMVNMLGQVFDIEPRPTAAPGAAHVPAAPPTTSALLRDSISGKGRALARGVRRLAHPVAIARSAQATVAGGVEAIRQGRGAPRTSLNRPIESARRIGAVRVPLDEMKAVAHAAGVKLNDVFLCLVAGALRQVLIARGEPVAGRSIRASVAVTSSHLATTSGNHAGTVVVPIPIDGDDPAGMLGTISQATRRAKEKQLVVASTGLLVLLARTGITRLYIRRQHLINVLTTNLPGPPVPLYFARARVADAVALPPIAGNVTVSFAALSYAGEVTLSFVADGSAWQDAGLLETALGSSWSRLSARVLGTRAAA